VPIHVAVAGTFPHFAVHIWLQKPDLCRKLDLYDISTILRSQKNEDLPERTLTGEMLKTLEQAAEGDCITMSAAAFARPTIEEGLLMLVTSVDSLHRIASTLLKAAGASANIQPARTADEREDARPSSPWCTVVLSESPNITVSIHVPRL
jgi:hypothetical protein